MLLKSAPPTPTMTMERGSFEAATMRSTVSSMSQITPSYGVGDKTMFYFDSFKSKTKSSHYLNIVSGNLSSLHSSVTIAK